MYIPSAFNEDRLDAQHDLIRTYPLGLLISSGSDGLSATPLPFHLVSDSPAFGTLQGHFARANPHWKSLDGQEVLVVFQGTQGYVTPSWYPSKAEHGKVVPTWNYTMVQARGPVRVIDDKTWLKQLVTQLTDNQESSRSNPWHVRDAPADYIESQLHSIIGIEIQIRHIEGKWKVSQNRPAADQAGVAEGFSAEGQQLMSELVKQYHV
jgi:transcriptional regulator